MRIIIDKGVYVKPVTANLVSDVLPTHFPDYEWYILFQVYELDGTEAKGSYTGEGRIVTQPHNEDFNVLVLGDPYRSTNLEEYLVSKNAIQDSIDSLDLITEALEFGWEKKRKKRGASSEWIEAFEFAKMQRKEYEGGSMARNGFHDRPVAARGLTSYRYRGRYGWIMIGARDVSDALQEARRSTDGVRRDRLEVWNGHEYEPV